jgi:hypothetical protein
MKFFKSDQLRNVATVATSSFSALILATSPALAITFAFCGNFTTGDGSVLPSQIKVDDSGNFDGFADISTIVSGVIRTYDESNFVGREDAINPDTNIESYKYTFNFNSIVSSIDPLDNFMAFLPKSFFPIQPGERPDLSSLNSITMIEVRDGIVRKDPDKLEIVPEPTGVLGTALALGLGGFLTKKNLSKLKKNNEAA